MRIEILAYQPNPSGSKDMMAQRGSTPLLGVLPNGYNFFICISDGVKTLAQSIRVKRHDGIERFDSSIGCCQEDSHLTLCGSYKGLRPFFFTLTYHIERRSMVFENGFNPIRNYWNLNIMF